MNREAPTLLAALCLGVLLSLSGGVSLLSRRTRGTTREPAREELVRGRAVASAALDSPLAMLSPARSVREAESEPARESSASSAEKNARASVAGRLLLDGEPPAGGAQVFFRAADGTGADVAPIDHEGRFRFEAGPGARLSFDLPSSSQRRLFLPQLVLRAEPGRTTVLDLDWRTNHVNLRVLGDPAGWNRARVQVAGPACEASFETDEDGEAQLSLVGAGLFTLRAVQPSGRTGVATLELDEGAELDSVVIRSVDPPAR